MGKFANLLMMTVAFQIASIIFLGQGSDTTATTIIGNQTTSLTDFVFQPTTYSDSSILNLLNSKLFLLASASLIIVGSLFSRLEFLVWIGLASTFITFIAPIYNLQQTIAGAGVFEPQVSWFLAILVFAPLPIYYIFALFDWIKGRD